MDTFHEVFSLIWFVTIVFLSFVSTVLQFILWSPTSTQDETTRELFMSISTFGTLMIVILSVIASGLLIIKRTSK